MFLWSADFFRPPPHLKSDRQYQIPDEFLANLVSEHGDFTRFVMVFRLKILQMLAQSHKDTEQHL